ncbi:MAG: hypothetical protein NZ578_12050 [Candidatus Binatia bacterium]|nr:hypothetical protein [Candidatus Binatia bacterium]
MRRLWTMPGSVGILVLLLSELAWADAFVRFLYQQKVGQEMTVTGYFRRFSYKKLFFRRDDKTGKVEYFEFYGLSMIPTQIIGNGSLSLRPNALDSVLFLYPDQELVKDLPEQGANLWFTGTLLGFQYGISGITSAPGSGGDPYILLQRVSTHPPAHIANDAPPAPQHGGRP